MLSVFSSSKCNLFHNSNVFVSCIIHILYIYSTNIGTEYFKHRMYSPFFFLQNAVCFIILTFLVPVLFTFYIQGVLKLKKNNSGAKRLTLCNTNPFGMKLKNSAHSAHRTSPVITTRSWFCTDSTTTYYCYHTKSINKLCGPTLC